MEKQTRATIAIKNVAHASSGDVATNLRGSSFQVCKIKLEHANNFFLGGGVSEFLSGGDRISASWIH